MSSYTKKVRKPLRSALISLLAKVDDPKVQILEGEFDIQAGIRPVGVDDSGFLQQRANGLTSYTIRIELYDPDKDDVCR